MVTVDRQADGLVREGERFQRIVDELMGGALLSTLNFAEFAVCRFTGLLRVFGPNSYLAVLVEADEATQTRTALMELSAEEFAMFGGGLSAYSSEISVGESEVELPRRGCRVDAIVDFLNGAFDALFAMEDRVARRNYGRNLVVGIDKIGLDLELRFVRLTDQDEVCAGCCDRLKTRFEYMIEVLGMSRVYDIPNSPIANAPWNALPDAMAS